jgi:hypothetical protein
MNDTSHPTFAHAVDPDPIETKNFRRGLVRRLRPAVARLAREMAPHVALAEQVGLVGVVIALERTKTDAALGSSLDGHDLGSSLIFRRVALAEAREEIQKFLNR